MGYTKTMMIEGLVTVRTQSTRLPKKCLLPFGDVRLIEHVIERCGIYDIDPIICTTLLPEDDVLVEIAKSYNVRYFRGSVKNKLKRWYDCATHFGLSCFHSVDADDPFFDGDEMHASMRLLATGYDMVTPTPSSAQGGASVGYSLRTAIIANAIKGTDDDTDTEMMWHFIQDQQDLKITNLPESKDPKPQMRLTLDYEEDYWLLASLQRMVGRLADRSAVDAVFARNPDLAKINWFRNEEWADGQRRKTTVA